MTPTAPRYTRDELVAIISKFYTFLTEFYLPASALKLPPSGGWPNITAEATAESGKSHLVIDLIKHLPYIDGTHAHKEITNIHHKCDVIDYSTRNLAGNSLAESEMSLLDWIEEREEERNNDDENDDEDEDEEEDEDEDPEEWHCWHWDEGPVKSDIPNFISLASGYESGGRDIVLDVFKGIIYEDEIRCNQRDGVDIEAYFEALKESFRKLVLVPTPGKMFEQRVKGQGEVAEFENIYRKFGWPGASYQKEQALEEVARLKQRLDEDL